MKRTTITATLAVAIALGVGTPATSPLLLTKLGTAKTGPFKDADPRYAEINAFDPRGERVYIVNPSAGVLDVLDASNPALPTQLPTPVGLLADCQAALDVDCPLAPGLEPNSVAIHNGFMAVVVANAVRTDNGHALLYRLRGTDTPRFLRVIEVGAVPDMVTFTDDGRYILTANEGEPSQDYAIDPPGSVSIISVEALGFKYFWGYWFGDDDGFGWFGRGGFWKWHDRDDDDRGRFGRRRAVRHVTFERYDHPWLRARLEADGVRIFGPGATVAQDLEPEYIATRDGKAYVTLQENNALAIIDIDDANVERIVGLGLKDHSLPENELDPSDRDATPNPPNNAPAIKIGNWPVFGLYQPDGIDTFSVKGKTYLITANEGDAREYTGAPGYVEALRVSSGSYVLDATAFPNAALLKQTSPSTPFARLNASKASGDTDGDGDFDRIEIFGGRSVTIRDARGKLVWDSGDMFERLAEAQSAPAVTLYKTLFNTSNSENAFDGRSDDKGVEPESVVVGRVNGRLYAFVALERDGGLVVLDISLPTAPEFETYVNNRLFPAQACNTNPTQATSLCGDLGPEGLTFVPAHESPTGKALVVITHEVSSTTTIWQVE